MRKKKKIILIFIALSIICLGIILFSWYKSNSKPVVKSSIRKNKNAKIVKAKLIEDENNTSDENEQVSDTNIDTQNNNNSENQKVRNTVEKQEQVKNNYSQNNVNQNTSSPSQQSIQQNTSSTSQVGSTPEPQPTPEYRIDYYRENGAIKEFGDHASCVQTSINYLFTDTDRLLGSSCVPTGSGKEIIELRIKN